MARPQKYDLQYFPLDVDFFDDHKLLMIEEDFGIKGGYMAIRLMAMVYTQGYYLEWKDKSELSCAKRVGNGYTGALVAEILKSCLKHGLFDKGMFDDHQILTSRGIQRRWTQVMVGLRRNVNIKQAYNLILLDEQGVSSEETPLPDAETPLPDAETPMSGAETPPPGTLMPQKEKKGNEIKVKKKVTADEPPSPAGKSAKKLVSRKKKLDHPPEPHWQPLVDTWFSFVKENFGDMPSFSRDEPRVLKRIISQLKKRAEAKGVEWTEVAAVERFRSLLTLAIRDRWLSENFLLSNLEKQFDKIVLNNLKNGQQSNGKIAGATSFQPSGTGGY